MHVLWQKKDETESFFCEVLLFVVLYHPANHFLCTLKMIGCDAGANPSCLRVKVELHPWDTGRDTSTRTLLDEPVRMIFENTPICQTIYYTSILLGS